MELNLSIPQKPLTIKSVPSSDPTPLHRIALEVCSKHGLTMRHMRARCWFQSLVALRYEYFYRAAAETSKPFTQIARLVGVDHSTVGYGMTRFALQYHLPVPRTPPWRKAALAAKNAVKPYPRNYHKLEPWERRRLNRKIELEYKLKEICIQK